MNGILGVLHSEDGSLPVGKGGVSLISGIQDRSRYKPVRTSKKHVRVSG